MKFTISMLAVAWLASGCSTLATAPDDDSVSGTEFLDFDSNGSTPSNEGFNSPIVTGLTAFTPGDVIEVTLPANVYAFEANVQVSSTGGGGICVEAGSSYNSSGCGANVFLPTANTQGFIGITSASALTTIWLGSPTNIRLTLDNFEIGEQSQAPPPATPEIATMFMIGTGLISLGVMRRRRSI